MEITVEIIVFVYFLMFCSIDIENKTRTFFLDANKAKSNQYQRCQHKELIGEVSK